MGSSDGTLFSHKIQSSDQYIFFYAHNSDWSAYSFFIIDVDTGEITRKTNLLGPHFEFHNEKIYSVGRNTQKLQVMKLSDFSMETIDLTDELREFVFETQCMPFFHKDSLYVALKKKGEEIYSSWGKIDLEKY